MTVEELRGHVRELTRLLELHERDLKPADLAPCLSSLSLGLQDEATEVPAEVFADLNADGRRFALSGLVFVIADSLA